MIKNSQEFASVISAYSLAVICLNDWEANSMICWDQAELLIERCQNILSIDNYPVIKKITEYSSINDDWDVDIVEKWPITIMETLKATDKFYQYRPGDNNDWEVYGTFVDEDEDWTATVSTESIAQRLVDMLNS